MSSGGTFIPHTRACRPAIDDAPPEARHVAPRAASVCGIGQADACERSCEHNCDQGSHLCFLSRLMSARQCCARSALFDLTPIATNTSLPKSKA
jgi:hypothetical protein